MHYNVQYVVIEWDRHKCSPRKIMKADGSALPLCIVVHYEMTHLRHKIA
jgi:hypothetical protein